VAKPNNVVSIQPTTATHSKTDTIEVTERLIDTWKPPPFQRPLRENAQFWLVVETIKRDNGVIPGVLTLAVFGPNTYLLDGQHRIHAFRKSGCPVGYVDVRILTCHTMKEMADEFVAVNSHIVKFTPDDILRGLEESNEPLRLIRQRCPFVGYGNIRRNTSSAILSMSSLLRAWAGSASECPVGGGKSALHLAEDLTHDDAENLCTALSILYSAWGNDVGYAKLWNGLNLILCFWLWRNTVVKRYSPNTALLEKEQFKRCMMSLSADEKYLDWLLGRNMSDRDRSPAYSKIKAISIRRIHADTGKKVRLPKPDWCTSHEGVEV
jgi:hypothetical protein